MEHGKKTCGIAGDKNTDEAEKDVFQIWKLWGQSMRKKPARF